MTLLSGALFVVLLFASWAHPYHSIPWPTGFNDGLALTAGLCGIVFLAVRRRGERLFFSRQEMGLLLILVVHVLSVALLTDNRSVWPYVVTVAIAYLCFKLARGDARLLTPLTHALWLFGLVTAVLGGFVWSGALGQIPLLADWVVGFDGGGRWAGTLNQANNTGTMLLWGMIAGAFLADRLGQVSAPAWLKGLGQTQFLLSIMAMAATLTLVQSRTATLNLMLLAGVALWRRDLLPRRAAMALWLGIGTYFWTLVGTWLWQPVASGFSGRQLQSSYRFEVWQDLALAVMDRPWLGYGVGGVSRAFVTHADSRVGYGVFFAQSHNLILDALVWFGVPLGIGILVLAAHRLMGLCRNLSTVNVFSAMAVMVAMVHALLEYPLHYPYLLLPFVLFLAHWAGPLTGYSKAASGWRIRTAWVAGVGLVFLSTLLALLSYDYMEREHDLRQARVEQAMEGGMAAPRPSRFGMLWELDALNRLFRLPDGQIVTQVDLDEFHRLLFVFPDRYVIRRGVRIFDHNKHLAYAAFWRQKGCAIYGEAYCRALQP